MPRLSAFTGRVLACAILMVAWDAVLLADGSPTLARLSVEPTTTILTRPEASQQLLVRSYDDHGGPVDVTRRANYRLLPTGIARIGADGLVTPLSDGKTTLVVEHGKSTARVAIEVRGLRTPRPVAFDTEILPILTKARCNSGTCHGKAEGQHGFKLSVFGFDPQADYDAITKESGQRRVTRGSPERSLVVRKATAAIPHGGGLRIQPGSLSHQLLCRWIREGAGRVSGASPVVAIAVEPTGQILHAGQTQQIQVTAIDAQGSRFCVTRAAEYESNADFVAHVDSNGFVTASNAPGEAAILVRYLGNVAICRMTRPRDGTRFSRPPEANVLDRLAWNRLESLGIQPSQLCDDSTFLRRAYLDVIGRLPTPQEARSFLTEKETSHELSPHKRDRLIDRLLDRPEYADYWAMRWSDVLRVDREKMTASGAVAVTRWLRGQFAANRPYDEFVREILTARGDTSAEGPAAIYRVLDTPEELSRSVSQLFLGVRIECAQCHHHPFEKWGQDDYYGLAGFFTGVATKGLPTGNPAVVVNAGGDLKNPRRDVTVATHALGAPPAVFTGVADRRVVLADWITSPQNPYFVRAIVNRLWAHFFGRGLIEPIDDLRATNPPTNEPLLNELARQLVVSHYDLKAVLRLILNSRLYQLSGKTNEANLHDEQNFSHAQPKSLEAEVLLDAVSDAAGVPEKFEGWPAGLRAVELWDNDVESYFLRIFGRPKRATVCECERSNEPSISQALHLLNSEELAVKVESPEGRARKLANSKLTPREIIDELYLATLSRFPSTNERARALAEFERSDRPIAAEDVLWALINSKQFLYAW